MILTTLSMIAAVACYAIKELHAHSKLKWSKGDDSFWGEESYWRKYASPIDPPVDNWYYRLFNIGYREKWPTSATLTVALTDGMHLAQAGFKLFLALSFVPLTGWIWAGVIWVLWWISFTIFYRIFSR